MSGPSGKKFILFYWLSTFLFFGTCLAECWQLSKYFEAKSGKPSAVICGSLALVFLILTIGLAVICWRRSRRPFLFSNMLAVFVLLMVCLFTWIGGILLAPSWPNREFRPVVLNTNKQLAPVRMEDFGPNSSWNSWGQRDLERTVNKASDQKRIVFIGDSFLEGGFCSYPLPLLTQKFLDEKGEKNIECINLGVSGTGPIHYFYRLAEVGENLYPEEIVIMFYSGNDFLNANQAYPNYAWAMNFMFVNERPLPSLLGSIFPGITWVIANRLSLSELARGSKSIPNELEFFKQLPSLPPEQALDQAVAHMHEHYFPKLSESEIKGILGRGGDAFWKAFAPKEKDQEFIQYWILNGMISWESGTAACPTSISSVTKDNVDPQVDATITWMVEMAKRCERRHLPITICVAPTGIVDPDFCAFWKPWPRYFCWNYYCHARHVALVKKLKENGLNYFDLAEVLDGVPGTYRKSDAHWNEKGHATVAHALCERLLNKKTAK